MELISSSLKQVVVEPLYTFLPKPSTTFGSDHLRFPPNFAKTLALPRNLKIYKKNSHSPWG